jgi:hypothetical protein
VELVEAIEKAENTIISWWLSRPKAPSRTIMDPELQLIAGKLSTPRGGIR